MSQAEGARPFLQADWPSASRLSQTTRCVVYIAHQTRHDDILQRPMARLIDRLDLGLIQQSFALSDDREDGDRWAGLRVKRVVRQHPIRAALDVLAADHSVILAGLESSSTRQ